VALVDTSNLELGPCQVFWNNTDLGYHKGATLEYSETYERLEAEDHGEILYDRLVLAKTCKVTVAFQEVVLDLLEEVLINSANPNGDTSRLQIGEDPGAVQRSFARLLRLHPIKNAAADYSDDVYLFLALPFQPISWRYDNEDRTCTVIFEALKHSDFSPALWQIGGVNYWS